jgi:hypothetical protein
VTQLRQRLGVDLADALGGDVELAAGLFERVVRWKPDPQPYPQDAFLGSVARTRAAAAPGRDWAAASKGRTAPSSSIRSTKVESPSTQSII